MRFTVNIFRLIIAICCLPVSASLYAQANQQCPPWVPTVEEKRVDPANKITINSPQVAPMLKAARAIDNMLKKNAAFNSIPEARLRTKLYLTRSGLYGAKVIVAAYSKDGWDNKCGILPQADLMETADAHFGFSINLSNDICLTWDYAFSFLEKGFESPVHLESIAEGVDQYRTGASKHEFTLVTKNGKLPWVPFTIGEYLDAYEKQLDKKREDFERERKIQENYKNKDISEQAARDLYESIKKKDPKGADEFWKKRQEIKAGAKQREEFEKQRLGRKDSALTKEMNDFRQYRASFAPQQLKEQAFLGRNKYNLWDEASGGVKRPLVKMSPEFDNPADKNAIKWITIYHWGDSKWKGYADKAWKTLDYIMLQSMMK